MTNGLGAARPAAEVLPDTPETDAGAERSQHRRRRFRDRKRPWRLRATGLVLAPLLAVVGWSYVGALRAPGNENLAERSIEWLRDHHLSGVVNAIESTWYRHHRPRVGGRPKGGLPTVAAPAPTIASPTTASPTTPPRRRLPLPANVVPLAAPALPGEGQWQPAGDLVGGLPAVELTYMRPDALHTSLVAAVAWMDTNLLRAELVPGLQVPGHGPWASGSQVPENERVDLLAAFNSGFRMSGSHGGFYAEGRSVGQLVPGAASLVVRTDSTVTVGEWGRDLRLGPDVAAVRQNLSPVVDGGALVAGLDDNLHSRWGATLGNKVLVWRSGVGVDRNGGLIYVAGPGLSVRSLAVLLARAGCVRAMELDINFDWVTFNLYRHAPDRSIGSATKLLDGMRWPATRYLSPDSRDFVALYARRYG
jgi:hypothetical protein